VGGPGKWFNMTPLTHKANKHHERDVESGVKGRVHTGSILEYHVTPKYSSRSGSIGIISEAGKGLSKKNKDDLKDIVRSEDHVPTELSIRVATKEKKNGKYQSVSPKTLTISNVIERSPESYFLEGGGTKIQPIDVNNMSGTGELTQEGIPKELQSKAGAIWTAVQVRQAEPDDPRVGSYDVLSKKAGIAISSDDREYLVLRPRATG
jgi:hypothetical protein